MTSQLPSVTRTVPTLVEVWAPWCSTCRDIEAEVLAAAESHASNVRFERVNASAEPDRARDLEVLGTPTFVGFRDGVEVFRRSGRPTAAEIDEMFESLASISHLPPLARRSEAVLSIAAGGAMALASVATGSVVPLGLFGLALVLVGVGLWMRGRGGD